MYFTIEKHQHLYYLSGPERERETIERLFLNAFCGQGMSSEIAKRHGIHWHNHVLVTDVRFDTINPACPENGDIDLLLLPCNVNTEQYANGLMELEYDYEHMLLLEIKTTLAGVGNRVTSSKLKPNRYKSLIGQLKKYRRLGFNRCAVVQLFIAEPVTFTDSSGQPVQDIRAWLGSNDISIHCAEQEVQSALPTDGAIEIPHYAIAIGSIPGRHEGAASSYSFITARSHLIEKQTITHDLRADLENLLTNVLPSIWGQEDDLRFHPMPIVRACQACHHLFVQHRWYQYERVCHSCLTQDDRNRQAP